MTDPPTTHIPPSPDEVFALVEELEQLSYQYGLSDGDGYGHAPTAMRIERTKDKIRAALGLEGEDQPNG